MATPIWKRVLKWLGWLLGGAIATAGALYLVLLLINWRDQPPSEFARRLEANFRNRPVVADADNAYIYMLGFGAPPEAAAYEVGFRRAVWLRQWAEHPETLKRDDLLALNDEYRQAPKPAVQNVITACGREFSQCATALEGNDAALLEWLATEDWRLDRYLDLLQREGWSETIPADAAIPFPAYAPVMDGQRLLHAQAYYLAGQGDASAVRDLLNRDARFWRAVLASSDTLMTKMISVAALTRNFRMGNLTLRRLSAELQIEAMPEQWQVALTDDERSLLRSLTGEWIYGQNILRNITVQRDAWETSWGIDRSPLERLYLTAQRPFVKLQDATNKRAELFVRATDALNVPLAQFPEGLRDAESILTASEQGLPYLKLYNPIGSVLAYIGSVSYVDYPPRVADLEGIRRAAVLTVELRSRKVAEEDIASALAGSSVRTPYSGEPFLWDAQERAIVFVGLAPDERGRHAFNY